MVAPVGLAVARKIKTNPIPVIIAIAVSSNLQGAATLVGDTTSILLGNVMYGMALFVRFDFPYSNERLLTIAAVYENAGVFSGYRAVNDDLCSALEGTLLGEDAVSCSGDIACHMDLCTGILISVQMAVDGYAVNIGQRCDITVYPDLCLAVCIIQADAGRPGIGMLCLLPRFRSHVIIYADTDKTAV